MARTRNNERKKVESLKHNNARRRVIPTAEAQSTAERVEQHCPVEPAVYKRARSLPRGEKYERDEDLDPQVIWNGASLRLSKDQREALEAGEQIELSDAQLVWRGKDNQDWSDLVVNTPPIYIQEKIHPKAIIDDLERQAKEARDQDEEQTDLFGDFNGIEADARTEYYKHDQNWQNRMILGDSLQIMASLAQRENLQGKVQCVYIDPPYGISFGSNWQVSTRSRDVKDGKLDQIARDPEQVKAFRDTWKDGIHSYLTYVRDRLTVIRDLLDDSGSVFVQIGDENVHRVRSLLDEIFGASNFVSSINFRSMSPLSATNLTNVYDHILWYAKSKPSMKYRNIYQSRETSYEPEFRFVSDKSGHVYDKQSTPSVYLANKERVFRRSVLMSSGFTPTCFYRFEFEGKEVSAAHKSWRTHRVGMERLIKANRLIRIGKSVYFRHYHTDFGLTEMENTWTDTAGGYSETKIYVVQTHPKIVQRCILMTTDPGDLVLDPTCGSGTTATTAEHWGRRWITIDTSRVALALARARLMTSKYPYYFLADSKSGQDTEHKVTGLINSNNHFGGDIRQGFVLRRKPRIYLKDIANNAEIDVIWDNWQKSLEEMRAKLNSSLGESWEEWELPRYSEEVWSHEVKKLHSDYWDARTARQQEIEESTIQKVDVKYLYDQPYEDKSKVRVAGPFTVESLSPHRGDSTDEDKMIDDVKTSGGNRSLLNAPAQDFATIVLENLKSAGVHQSDKNDRIVFSAIEGWPGEYIAANGTFEQGGIPKKAGIFIGPEFGTVTRCNLRSAAAEANDLRCDVLIACGFNFDAHSSDVNRLGPLQILKAKINPDLHMADDLKNTGKGNLFIVFGEPDIDWKIDGDGKVVVEVLGIDVFDPKTGEVRASGKDDIAAWFIDTDYNEESFFVRHAYFMGSNDPYKALRTTLKAEIDEQAWATLYRDTSRPFNSPSTGRFAVKVINHFGDEVMKVITV